MNHQLGFDLGEPERARDAPLFDPAMIRAEALALIDRVRGATADGPWDRAGLRHHRMLFPHLVSWLPDAGERDQLCFAFAREADRVEALLAA